MAIRLPMRAPAKAIYESLWINAPPSFLAPALASHSFSTTTTLATTIKKTKRRDPRDTYTLRQAKARKDANLSRQAALREQRKKELGDPIRGIPTAFVESFDTVVPQQVELDANDISLDTLKLNPDHAPSSPADKENHLDHGITHEELGKALDGSRFLTEPINTSSRVGGEPEEPRRQAWEARHQNSAEAVQRIVSLASGSSKHRTKKNIERIVDTFGRHITDQNLRPKAPAISTRNQFADVQETTPRAGPDTGSAEVQIGILTAKIRVLADRYEGENRNDKINKRNLRLLLHRRQKLLAYMERKERGSQRWSHMLETLGLTPACWKGQIAV